MGKFDKLMILLGTIGVAILAVVTIRHFFGSKVVHEESEAQKVEIVGVQMFDGESEVPPVMYETSLLNEVVDYTYNTVFRILQTEEIVQSDKKDIFEDYYDKVGYEFYAVITRKTLRNGEEVLEIDLDID